MRDHRPEAGHPKLTGNVELLRAALDLGSLMQGPSDFDPAAVPFLVALEAQVRISAKRNVWIRDRDMNLEMAGDVDVRKDRNDVRIYRFTNRDTKRIRSKVRSSEGL